MMRPLRPHLDQGPGSRRSVLSVLAALAVLTAVGCSDVESTDTTRLPNEAEAVTEAPEVVTEAAEAVTASACVGAQEVFASFREHQDDEEHIASGEAEGLCWRLFALPAPTENMTAQLCVETVVDDTPHAYYCTTAGGAGVSSDGPMPAERRPVLSGPSVLPAEPPLVFGLIEGAVARVVVETDSGAHIEADIVGQAQAHYVAVAPEGTRPVAVITYASGGHELDRFSLTEEASFGWEMSEPEFDCDVGPDGSYECEGTASGSAWGTMTVKCEEAEDGQMICEEADSETWPGDGPASGSR